MIKSLAKRYSPGIGGQLRRDVGELAGGTVGSIAVPLRWCIRSYKSFIAGTLAVGGAGLFGGTGKALQDYIETGVVTPARVSEAAKNQATQELVGRGLNAGFKLAEKDYIIRYYGQPVGKKELFQRM